MHFGDEAEAAAACSALAGKAIGTGVDGKQLLLRLDFALSTPLPAAGSAGAGGETVAQ